MRQVWYKLQLSQSYVRKHRPHDHNGVCNTVSKVLRSLVQLKACQHTQGVSNTSCTQVCHIPYFWALCSVSAVYIWVSNDTNIFDTGGLHELGVVNYS